MYGRGPLGARRFCKECVERCIRPISNENALLSINLKRGALGKNHSTKSFFCGGGGGGGGGGKLERLKL